MPDTLPEKDEQDVSPSPYSKRLYEDADVEDLYPAQWGDDDNDEDDDNEIDVD